MLAFIPSPPADGIHLGPLFVHAYGLMYAIGIALAVYITARRWAAAGGDRALVYDVVVWAVPVGLVSQALMSLDTPQLYEVTSIQPSLRADVPVMPSILMMQRNAMTDLRADARFVVDDPEGRPGTARRR
jgi:hypothetical protein